MNTVKIKYLEWGNLFSYGDNNRINFDTTLSQIVGVNGAGKSSIPLILEETYYNKNSKGFKKAEIPNRHLEKPYWMTSGFSFEGDEYRIEIRKSSTLKATLYKNDEDISANTASKTIQMIEEMWQIPFKTFTQLFYQNTDASLEFLRATDSKRKEFLINLFDMSEYLEKQKKYSEALKNIGAEIKKLEGGVNSTINSIQSLSKDSERTPLTTVAVPKFPEHLLSEKADLEIKIENIEEENKKIVRSNKVLKDLSELRTREEITADLEKIKLENKDPIVEEVGRRNSEIKSAKAVIQKIEGLGDKCPTCLQTVDSEFIQGLIDTNNFTIESNREKARELVSKVKEIETAERLRKNLTNELSQRQNLESRKLEETYKETLDYEELEEKLSSIVKEINFARDEISQKELLNKKAESENSKIEYAKSQLDRVNKELNEYEEQLVKLTKQKGPLETLKKALGPQGLVAYKLEGMVIDLETHTNAYLSKLSDGQFNLTFNLDNDKLNVVILDNTREVSMTALSTGERARVAIGTLLGIRKLMQDISKTTLNVLFLDEVISVMDDQGKEQLVEVLLQEEGLNTFLVSHSWSHPLVKKLEVIKENDISTIKE